jgi:hypothetical protein
MSNRFPNKYAAEKLVLQFDMSAELETGETLTLVSSVTVSVLSGADSSPSDLLNGAASISAGAVLVPVKAGVAGVDYRIDVVCATSNALKELAIMGKIYVQ